MPAPSRKKLFSGRPRSATLSPMRKTGRILFRLVRATLLLIGIGTLLVAAAQFTNLPWRSYKSLSVVPDPDPAPPTHILVMGGSGIPGESGLGRTFFGAQAALRNPSAEVLIAMPLGTNESFASRAYVDELRLRGVPADHIRVLAGGRNTREQAFRLAEDLAGRSGPLRILVVSDPYHIQRTAACVRKAFADLDREVRLAGLPVFPLSIEDPLEFIAGELDAPGPAPAARAAIPDIGSSFRFRYNLWANFSYTQAVFREHAAMLYYRLRGWL